LRSSSRSPCGFFRVDTSSTSLTQQHEEGEIMPRRIQLMRSLLTGFFWLLVLNGCKTAAHRSATGAESWPVYQVMVERGDTLASIAQKYDTNWEEIAELNGISDPTNVEIGRILKVVPGRAGLVPGYGPGGKRQALLFGRGSGSG